MLIDSHAHLDSERYADDREEMLRRAWEAGVGTVLAIGIGEQASGMDGALGVCRQFNRTSESGAGIPRLYASAGVYPHNTRRSTPAILAQLDNLLPSRGHCLRRNRPGLLPRGRGARSPAAGLIRQLEIAATRKRPFSSIAGQGRGHRRLGRVAGDS